MLKTTMVAIMFIAAQAFGLHAYAGSPAKEPNVSMNAEVKAFIEFGTEDNKDAEIKSSDTNITLKVDHEVSPSITAFGELSADLDISSGNNITSRFGYVGLKNDRLGAFSIGKTMSIMDQYVDKADVFQNSGNQGVQKTPFKLSNSWKYENSFGDFKVGAQGRIYDDTKDEMFDLVQYGVVYKGIGIVGAWDNNADINYYGIGTKQEFGKYMVAGSLTLQDAATDVIGYELAAGYKVMPDLQFIGGWQDTDATGDDGNLTAGTYYTLGNAELFAEGDFDLTTEDTTTRIGINIKF
tara:strand:- start:25515 stop:26399 length:885 start_codon:yes stop_codon:yes gene_type:complete